MVTSALRQLRVGNFSYSKRVQRSDLVHEAEFNAQKGQYERPRRDEYINQRGAQILVNSLYFFVKWLYMFGAIISPS